MFQQIILGDFKFFDLYPLYCVDFFWVLVILQLLSFWSCKVKDLGFWVSSPCCSISFILFASSNGDVLTILQPFVFLKASLVVCFK